MEVLVGQVQGLERQEFTPTQSVSTVAGCACECVYVREREREFTLEFYYWNVLFAFTSFSASPSLFTPGKH